MDDFFIEQTDDDGNVTYVKAEVPEANVGDIANDAFFQDPRYKKVADSDAQRRIKIRELRAEMETLASEDEVPGDDTTPTEPEPNAEAPTSDDDLIARVMAKITAQSEAETKLKNERTALIDGLLEKHKLPEETYRSVLEDSTDAVAVAEQLGRAVLAFDQVSGGNSATPLTVDTVMAGVYENLGIEPDSPK